jgi:hypothetical protein
MMTLNPTTKCSESNEDREEEWDRQTVYVEPHNSSICASPPKLIRHLKTHSRLPERSFPVQNVTSGSPSWAFITLSQELTELVINDTRVWPRDWVVLSKSEWKRRDIEYATLVKKLSCGRIPPPK